MRLHLWQRLFLAFAVLSGVALFGFAAWQEHSFHRGFLGYLDAVALQRLQPATARLAAAYAEHASWNFLRENPQRFGELIEPSHDDQARDPPLADADSRDQQRAENPAPDQAAPSDRPPAGWRRSPPNREFPPRPRPHGPPDLMPRLLLVDLSGNRIAGNSRVGEDAASLPVTIGARNVATLRLAPIPQLSGASDLAFAQAQSRSALWAALAILVGAFLLAFALARWLLAPVRALAAGTRALASGDYTQRIALPRKDELGALSHDFNHLAATLEEHRDARRQWGADIAHELRTPLSILRGEIQALQDGVRPLGVAALDSLQAECERLGYLIEDLYQLSLADAGAPDFRFETIDLGELMLESADLQRAACADAGLSLQTRCDAPAFARADARRIAQLLDNLLANARRYTDSPGSIHVAIERRADRIEISVEDSAPGVPAAALPRLFDRLYRVESSRSRDAGGAGLGLSICASIVAAHDGTIQAQASPLGGLRIVISLAAIDKP